MKPLLCLLIVVAAAACTSPPSPAPQCAALPTLPAGATPAQRHRHHEAVITLYAECARTHP